MTNFFRLLTYSWRYRSRFFWSLVCAGVAALMWGANISAVYPLLKILFYSQNVQTWMAEKIEETDVEARVLQTRLDEVRRLGDIITARPIRPDEIKSTLREYAEAERSTRPLPSSDLEVTDGGSRIAKKPPVSVEHRVAEARHDELSKMANAILSDDKGAGELNRRSETLSDELSSNHLWARRYAKAQPYVVAWLPADGFDTLVLLICLVMTMVVIKGIFQFFQDVLVADLTQLSLFEIRRQMYRKVLSLDLASIEKTPSAELMARFTNDMEMIAQGINTIAGKMIREPMRIVSCLSVAFWLNWRLTLMALIVVPISAVTTARVGKTLKKAVRKSLESVSSIYRQLQETFQGIRVVKAYNRERYERLRFYGEIKRLYRKSIRVATIDAMSDPALEFLALSSVCICLLAGSYLVMRETMFLDLGLFRLQLSSRLMSIEDLLTLYAMLAGVSDPIRKLSNVHSKIQRAAASADRICALMDTEPQVKNAPGALRDVKHSLAIEFDRVSFSYNGRDPVIRDVSLKVRHGETIAFVGHNGCGKSTLMSLLPRFWDVASGSIRIDGVDVREMHTSGLRRMMGIVTQETVLFADTVAANLSFGDPSVSREQIIEASKRAYAHQFIEKLPDGYDTVLADRGMNLSGGQRQRLALARAILRNPSILILDEATSAVDIEDEALIRRAIEEFAVGRTTFIISHSLGTMSCADRIVMMSAGRIEAIGTEDELRRSNPVFRRLHEIHYQRESA
jgi:ABC-type multidrug transport system fused ATPase/permease subunit